MYFSVSDLENFYNSEIGGIVQNILQRHISEAWGDTGGLRVLGVGYASPYLDPFHQKTERVLSLMSPKQGASHWVPKDKNLTFLSDENTMPIENSSVDRILLIHHLENCDNLELSLREIWRILKANGRLLVIVPNRVGVWAKADWSPFGHGTPFTASQLCSHLRDSMFILEEQKGALFVPPIPDSPVMMRSANLIERMGGNFLPFVAGVHIMQMSKQIYASVDNNGTGSAVFDKAKEILTGGRATVPQGFSSNGRDVKSQEDYLDQSRP